MRYTWLSLLFFYTSLFFVLSAQPVPTVLPQQPTLRTLNPLDSIIVEYEMMSGHLIFEYDLREDESLYGAGRFFGLDMDDVYLINPRFRLGYEPGDKLRVPLPHSSLRTFIPYDSINFYCPVYYTFKKGETIYGLVHRTLQLDSEQTLYINNPGLTANNVSVGQQLFVGWLSIEGITAEAQGEIEDPYVRQNTALRERWNQVSRGRRLFSQKGKAAWTRQGDRNKFMALHRTAPLNSLIEIMDKRTNKTIYCRVVGRIPDQVYDKNVEVVVSPLLVKAFGVRDKFFYVEVRHY